MPPADQPDRFCLASTLYLYQAGLPQLVRLNPAFLNGA